MMATFGCEPQVKDRAELVFAETMQIVDGFCTPPPPKPEVEDMCPVPREELKCDIGNALLCARGIQEALNEDTGMPDWEEICP